MKEKTEIKTTDEFKIVRDIVVAKSIDEVDLAVYWSADPYYVNDEPNELAQKILDETWKSIDELWRIADIAKSAIVAMMKDNDKYFAKVLISESAAPNCANSEFISNCKSLLWYEKFNGIMNQAINAVEQMSKCVAEEF